MKRLGWTLVTAFCLLSLAGCQTMMAQIKASKAMHEGRYDESIALYQQVLEKDGNHAEALKGIGETYLRMKKGAEAQAALEKANRLFPDDKVAAINLGLAYNMNEAYDKALSLWRPFVEKEPDSNLSALLRRHMTLILYKDAAKQAKAAVQQELRLQTQPGDPNALAVSYFGDKGLKEEAKVLRKAMAAMLITDLGKKKTLKVMERVRLQKLFEELQLGMSGLVDEKTAPRVGRLLGVGRIVTGNMFNLERERLDVNSLVAEIQSGAETGRQKAEGPVSEFFKIEKAIAFSILRDLKIELTREEQEAIGRYATQSYPGLLYYGQGLDAQDQGEWDRAIEIFQRCVKEDPNGPCAVALRDAPTGEDAAADPEAIRKAVILATEADAAAAASGSGGDDGG